MSTYTRREAGALFMGAVGTMGAAACRLAAAPTMPATPNSLIKGVQIGVQSYSYRTLPLDQAIAGMVEAGINSCELWSGHVEPRDTKREELRKWREETPLDHFTAIGKKFRDAGVTLYAYNYSFRDDFSGREISRGFEMAKALGAKVITASSTVTAADRVQPYAAQHKMLVGMHNHSIMKANEFATPQDFAEAMKGRPNIAINLDIGHFTAANFDAVDFLSKHAADIVTLHLKDRKEYQGDNLAFGQGDTPIKTVLQLLRDRKLNIPANIEYEYDGGPPVAAVKKCLAYCKAALES